LNSNAIQTEKNIFSVCAEIWTWISSMNDGHISQLCHAATHKMLAMFQATIKKEFILTSII
jgi:hypothetical protein